MTTVLQLQSLRKSFDRGGFWSKSDDRVAAVDAVSLTLKAGKTLAIVGESGSGKSTTARLAMRLLEPDHGEVHLLGHEITHLQGKALRAHRKNIQMVFQDPFASLNPRMKIVDTVGEGLRVHAANLSKKERVARVAEMLELCGVNPEVMQRYPHQFSGGQRQRIGIARALIVQPKVLVLDEPVSALDVSVQAQILNLLKSLQQAHGFAYLFISHDLSVVRHIADEVAIMFAGRIVEQGSAEAIFATPHHPYTINLLNSVPIAHPDARQPIDAVEVLADQEDVAQSGCAYRLRCASAQHDCATISAQALLAQQPCACIHPCIDE
ncbi:MAG: ATP-binding cassette domain-containing protein [Zetaproteobacteria bacterium]|nr:ATP-binding cassette domain-containing protein [Zetaproteobacteria bacterium]